MDRIEQAFQAVSRTYFLPDDVKDAVSLDAPLPIGFGQTNSQPTTVQMMLEWLDPQPGDRVLDVGSGSGWTTALLAYLVRPDGRVYGVEKVPELVEFGAANAREAGVKNAEFFPAGSAMGLPQHGPYDRILVSAAADKLPEELLDQMKVGGKLVIPIQNSVLVIDKNGSDDYDTIEHPGFVFVPLV